MQLKLLNRELFYWHDYSYNNSTKPTMCHTENCSHHLSQEEIELLTPEEYSNFLAYGKTLKPELTPEEEDSYNRYLRSQRIFDL
nr:hypothetical protein [uncultured Mediterranean phage uvMED]BAR25525.1 hypothetical protein [uncultured Mediterranean phage uvMED]